MRLIHSWFTERASLVWRGQRGRSILGLIPSGCDERNAAAYIAPWIEDKLVAPNSGNKVIVGRIVADGHTSGARFVQKLCRALAKAAQQELNHDETEEPSIALEALVLLLHEHHFHPAVIIERFHSFASVPDDALLSMLSAMRSLEHDGLLTTVALSPATYDAIRQAAPKTLPFVNSVYGDNHDIAIMSPLSKLEFCAYAERCGISLADAKELYSLGGGPDIIYQALVDESNGSVSDIVDRCAAKVEGGVLRFTHYAIGDVEYHAELLARLLNSRTTADDLAFLKVLPQFRFLAQEGDGVAKCSGPVLQRCIQTQLRKTRQSTGAMESMETDRELRILTISANSFSSPLDLEDEIRSMETEIERTRFRARVVLKHCQAARPDDIVLALRRFNPQVVHFSGHGNELGIELRGLGDQKKLVLGTALANALEGRSVRLAVFNVCLSHGYAAHLAKNVDVVVVTKDNVSDEAAKQFTHSFYRTIAEGFSVGEAFKDATDSIGLYNLEDVFELIGDEELILLD